VGDIIAVVVGGSDREAGTQRAASLQCDLCVYQK